MTTRFVIHRITAPRPQDLSAPQALLDWLEPNGPEMRGRPFQAVRAETAARIAAHLGTPARKREIEEWLLWWERSATLPPYDTPKAELIALQLCAQPVYGGGVAHLQGQVGRQDVQKIVRERGDFIRDFLQAMFLETQQELKQRSIERVTLWRGAKRVMVPAQKETFKVIALPLQPLSSFTHDLDQAVRFTRQERGTLFLVSVPASRILATPATGFGVLPQREEIVYSMPPAVTLLDEGFVAQSDNWEVWQDISSFTLGDWVELLEQFQSQ